MNIAPGIDVSATALADLCRRYEVKQLSIFGSLSRGEARSDSDADVLVEYRTPHHQSLFEFMDLQKALTGLFGRQVDLVSRNGLSPYIGPTIIREARPFYAAE
jgi:predicted nucleotidyltransferase